MTITDNKDATIRTLRDEASEPCVACGKTVWYGPRFSRGHRSTWPPSVSKNKLLWVSVCDAKCGREAQARGWSWYDPGGDLWGGRST